MKTIQEWLNRGLRPGFHRHVLNGEPLDIGRGVFLIEYRNGLTAKVKQFAVVQPNSDGENWEFIGNVRAKFGKYSNGFHEAATWGGVIADKTYYRLQATCSTQVQAVEMLVRFCQTMRP